MSVIKPTLLLIGIFLTTSVWAVNFSFTDTEGHQQQLSDYKGKWVVVNFWATWCPPCRQEIPDLSDFHLENDDAVVIGINYEPELSNKELEKFIALYLISYPVTRVDETIIAALGRPRGLPTSIIIDPQGHIVKKISGMITNRRLNTLIDSYRHSH
jgi:thiol-disulfide isomerase/thioredoxin